MYDINAKKMYDIYVIIVLKIEKIIHYLHFLLMFNGLSLKLSYTCPTLILHQPTLFNIKLTIRGIKRLIFVL